MKKIDEIITQQQEKTYDLALSIINNQQARDNITEIRMMLDGQLNRVLATKDFEEVQKSCMYIYNYIHEIISYGYKVASARGVASKYKGLKGE